MVHLTTALDPASAVPLYEQLYRSLAAEMRAGTLTAGTRMPGKRRLAAELSVSVNTVDTAYQMLAAEGYLTARERSGFTVQEYLALPQGVQPPAAPSAPVAAHPADTAPPVQFDLSTRGVDPGLFPFRTWARLQKELLYSAPELLTPGDARGDAALRQALAEYLAEYRGVQCDPEQLVVGAGLEYLLGLLAPLLPGPAAVETPGYPRARQVLENNGVPCRCLPVDADGLSLTALSASDAAVCYVTPSHQFPTGVTMPAGRRAELLHWAARAPGRRYIIEDDYDSEFRFDTRPLPSLQGMAGADGPVVYLSTCSRSLAPGIRIAYMVLPRQLLGAWQAKYRLYSGTVGRFEQQTLARFITGGYFTRHLARERTAYKARRDALVAALRTSFAPEELTLAGLHTGLHLLAQLKDPPPDAALRAAARQYGVRCSLLSDYDLTGTAHSAAGTLVLALLGRNHCLPDGLAVPGVGYCTLGPLAPVVWLAILVALAESARTADGMDGTVCGCAFIAMLGLMTAMTLLGWFPLGVLPAALAGALMAFLLWNFYPAKLRPGAVGCQFLAGALGCVPLSVGWPGLTLPLALPYWLEGGMVALQIIVWKASGGRRQLFGTAPLHRWLEKRGFDPVNIFYIFGVLAMLGLALTLQAARAS